MKPEEILEGNKLIAEFMGHKIYPADGYPDTVEIKRGPELNLLRDRHKTDHIKFNLNVSYLEYHSSWDWLMPVVEKIRTRRNVIAFEISFSLGVVTKVWFDEKWNTYESNDPLEAVYIACIEFIKWYNQQKQ